MIDTGFRRPVCQEALEAGLQELGSDPSRRDVLVTHLHSDHNGMADLFAGPDRRIYMSGVDLQILMRWKIRAADWSSFPVIQKWFAVGECLSHLDYLKARGYIKCETVNGVRRYYNSSEA